MQNLSLRNIRNVLSNGCNRWRNYTYVYFRNHYRNNRIVGICVSYPIYTAMLNSREKKYAADIMKLAKEITDVDADTTAEEETK